MRRVSKNESALEESEERDGEVGAATAAAAQPPHQRRPSARFAIPSHSIDDAQPTVNDGPAIPTDPDRELSSEVRGENTVDLPLRAAGKDALGATRILFANEKSRHRQSCVLHPAIQSRRALTGQHLGAVCGQEHQLSAVHHLTGYP